MLVPRPVLDTLADRLARHEGGMLSASIGVEIDPLDLVRAGAPSVGHASFFASPVGRSLGGLGAAHRVVSSGDRRLADLDDAVVRLGAEVPAMVGFSFRPDGPTGTDWEGFPAASAVVPEIAVVRDSGRSRLVVTPPAGADGRHQLALLAELTDPGPVLPVADALVGMETRPEPEDWQRMVGEAVAAIGADAFTKVVLARTVVLRSGRPIAPFELVASLRDRYPSCRVFGWQEGRSAAFVGASPELLVSRRGSTFRTEPLAGSAPRGGDHDEDRALGDALLASAKDRAEHAIVVEDALARLGPLVDDAIESPLPRLQKFATVQHLATSIGGRTRSRVLELAEALHPTPAVGGSPRGAALEFIDKVEGIDRGWYAGGIGWVDAAGDGELAVGLRCALVSGERAVLFAGNGIVSGSDPAAELEETRLKLRPMLDLITGG
jgi:isochorismate synthase